MFLFNLKEKKSLICLRNKLNCWFNLRNINKEFNEREKKNHLNFEYAPAAHKMHSIPKA